MRQSGVEPLERRDLLSGVTLIAHGFNSDADGWVTAMAQAIAKRPDRTIDQVIYRWGVTDPDHDGGPLSVTSAELSGPALVDAETRAPEVAILLNSFGDVPVVDPGARVPIVEFQMESGLEAMIEAISGHFIRRRLC